MPSGSFLGIAPLCFLLLVALCLPTAHHSAQCPPVRNSTPTPDYGFLGPVTFPGQIALSKDLSPFLNCSPCGLNCLPSAVLMITDYPTDPIPRPEHRGLTCGYNARALQPQGKAAAAPLPHNLPVVLLGTSSLSSPLRPHLIPLTMLSRVRLTGQALSQSPGNPGQGEGRTYPSSPHPEDTGPQAMESHEPWVKLSTGLRFSSD